MSFSVEHLEFYLLILIRISSFVLAAPIFSYQTIPMKVKLALSIVLSIVAIQVVPVVTLDYTGIIGYSALVIQESLVGVVLGNIYTYLLMLVMVVTNMHHYVLRAILDTFRYFNIGRAVFSGDVVETAVDFMANYFMIGFRIVLPVFACMLVINVVLGVLTRAAPQMNMFVVGLQMKVLVGILILLIILPTLPMVTNFVFDHMKEIVLQIYNSFTPK